MKSVIHLRLTVLATFFGLFASSAHAANTFGSVGSLANGRQSHTATLLHNGKVLVAGGHASFNPVAIAELFDPATGVWTPTGSLASARYAHTATLLPNGKVLVVGGYNSSANAIASAELYDSGTGTWSATGSLATGRAFHTAVLLGNGRCSFAEARMAAVRSQVRNSMIRPPGVGVPRVPSALRGNLTPLRYFPTARCSWLEGPRFGTFFASAELYDPAAGTWSTTGFLGTARAFHTATLLPNGRVLAVGGQTNGFGAVASAQLYDPATGAWTDTIAPVTARYGHSPRCCQMETCSSLAAKPAAAAFLGAPSFTILRGVFGWPPKTLSRALFTLRPSCPTAKYSSPEAATRPDVVLFVVLFDSRSAGWSEIGELINRRAYAEHTSTLLPNGKCSSLGATIPIAEQLSRSVRNSTIRQPMPGTLPAPSRTRVATTPPRCFPTAKCWWPGGYNGFSTLRVRSSTIQRRAHGAPRAVSPRRAPFIPRRFCRTAGCSSREELTPVARSPARNFTIRPAASGLRLAASPRRAFTTVQRCFPMAKCSSSEAFITIPILTTSRPRNFMIRPPAPGVRLILSPDPIRPHRDAVAQREGAGCGRKCWFPPDGNLRSRHGQLEQRRFASRVSRAPQRDAAAWRPGAPGWRKPISTHRVLRSRQRLLEFRRLPLQRARLSNHRAVTEWQGAPGWRITLHRAKRNSTILAWDLMRHGSRRSAPLRLMDLAD